MGKQYNFVKTFTFDGKRYYIRGDTEREVFEKMALKKRDLEEGKTVISSSMTVETWACKAVETYKTNQREITRSKYMSRMKHCILEEIGTMPLKSIKPIHCQEVLNNQAGKSKTQVNEVYQTLKFIFSTAYNNELLATDPSAKIIKPAYVTGHRRAITLRPVYLFIAIKYLRLISSSGFGVLCSVSKTSPQLGIYASSPCRKLFSFLVYYIMPV